MWYKWMIIQYQKISSILIVSIIFIKIIIFFIHIWDTIVLSAGTHFYSEICIYLELTILISVYLNSIEKMFVSCHQWCSIWSKHNVCFDYQDMISMNPNFRDYQTTVDSFSTLKYNIGYLVFRRAPKHFLIPSDIVTWFCEKSGRKINSFNQKIFWNSSLLLPHPSEEAVHVIDAFMMKSKWIKENYKI